MKTTIQLLPLIALLSFNLNAGVKVGTQAPSFSGLNDSSQTIDFSEFEGKYVVLEWLNHGCPFVKKHYVSGNMQKLQEELTAKGVVWLSIISSAEGKQGYMKPKESVAKRESIGATPTHVLLDPKGKIGKLYGARATPHMVVVGPDQTIVYTGAIDSISSANPKDIPAATNYVRSAVVNHMAGEEVSPSSTRAYGCSVKYVRK